MGAKSFPITVRLGGGAACARRRPFWDGCPRQPQFGTFSSSAVGNLRATYAAGQRDWPPCGRGGFRHAWFRTSFCHAETIEELCFAMVVVLLRSRGWCVRKCAWLVRGCKSHVAVRDILPVPWRFWRLATQMLFIWFGGARNSGLSLPELRFRSGGLACRCGQRAIWAARFLSGFRLAAEPV